METARNIITEKCPLFPETEGQHLYLNVCFLCSLWHQPVNDCSLTIKRFKIIMHYIQHIVVKALSHSCLDKSITVVLSIHFRTLFFSSILYVHIIITIKIVFIFFFWKKNCNTYCQFVVRWHHFLWVVVPLCPEMHVQHPHTPHHHPLARWRQWILTFSHIKHRHTVQFCGLGLEASLRFKDINWFCHQSCFNVQNDTTCPGWGHCPPTWCKDTVWVELTVSHPHKSLKETNRGFWFMKKRLSDKRTCTSVSDADLAWSCSESPPHLWVCGATWVFLLSPLGCPGVDIPHKRTAPSCPTPHERTVQMTGTESRLSAYLPGMERDSDQFTLSESFSSWASHWKIKV